MKPIHPYLRPAASKYSQTEAGRRLAAEKVEDAIADEMFATEGKRHDRINWILWGVVVALLCFDISQKVG